MASVPCPHLPPLREVLGLQGRSLASMWPLPSWGSGPPPSRLSRSLHPQSPEVRPRSGWSGRLLGSPVSLSSGVPAALLRICRGALVDLHTSILKALCRWKTSSGRPAATRRQKSGSPEVPVSPPLPRLRWSRLLISPAGGVPSRLYAYKARKCLRLAPTTKAAKGI